MKKGIAFRNIRYITFTVRSALTFLVSCIWEEKDLVKPQSWNILVHFPVQFFGRHFFISSFQTCNTVAFFVGKTNPFVLWVNAIGILSSDSELQIPTFTESQPPQFTFQLRALNCNLIFSGCWRDWERNLILAVWKLARRRDYCVKNCQIITKKIFGLVRGIAAL